VTICTHPYVHNNFFKLNEKISYQCVIDDFQCGCVNTCSHLLFFLGLWWSWMWFFQYTCLSWHLKDISHTHTYFACFNVNKKKDLCACLEGLVLQILEESPSPLGLRYAIFLVCPILWVWLKIHTQTTLVKSLYIFNWICILLNWALTWTFGKKNTILTNNTQH
jgi:hypothetical protein